MCGQHDVACKGGGLSLRVRSSSICTFRSFCTPPRSCCVTFARREPWTRLVRGTDASLGSAAPLLISSSSVDDLSRSGCGKRTHKVLHGMAYVDGEGAARWGCGRQDAVCPRQEMSVWISIGLCSCIALLFLSVGTCTQHRTGLDRSPKRRTSERAESGRRGGEARHRSKAPGGFSVLIPCESVCRKMLPLRFNITSRRVIYTLFSWDSRSSPARVSTVSSCPCRPKASGR